MEDATETVEGHVIDVACIRKNPREELLEKAQNHSKECALMGHCIKSGYGIVTEDDRVTLLDPEASKQVYDVPKALYPWTETTAGKRENMQSVLEYLNETVATSYREIQNATGVDKSNISRYIKDESALAACIVDDEDEGGYCLTPVGETALELPWGDVVVDS